jgi:hypothetical protein
MNKEIGGYFQLELPYQRNFLHSDGVLLNSGRNALEYILLSLKDIKHLWIPYFTCDAILEPLKKLNICYSFYTINANLELAIPITLHSNDYIIFTNYFGLKDNYIHDLYRVYGDRLIIDNSQALYSQPLPNIPTFYSPRKFVGVPDGGIAYISSGVSIDDIEVDISYDKCMHLLKRYDAKASEGYADFKNSSKRITNQPIRRMSKLTRHLLSAIDYGSIAKVRIENFTILHNVLSNSNKLDLSLWGEYTSPMVYPYYSNKLELRKRLIKSNVYVATYWPNEFEWSDNKTIEYQMSNSILPIPIDQRYGKQEMNYIIKIINDEL